MTQNRIRSWQKHKANFLFEWQRSYIFLSQKAIHLNLIFIRVTKKKIISSVMYLTIFFYFWRHLHSFKALSDNSFLLFQKHNKPWLLLNFVMVRFYFGFLSFFFLLFWFSKFIPNSILLFQYVIMFNQNTSI